MVAVFSLTCVMVLMPGAKVGSPDAVYARGIGNFMGFLGIDVRFAVGFGLLAFSSFVFDTMDVCTRLGRYVFQEITGLKGLWGGMAATFVTLVAPSIYLARSPAGSFLTFWTIFGTSNQLLAALTLVGVSVWLWRSGRPVWFALIPAFFMLANTGTALVLNFRAFWVRYSTLRATMNRDMLQTREMFYLPVNMVIAAVLLALGLFVVAEAFRGWRTARREGQAGSVGVAET